MSTPLFVVVLLAAILGGQAIMWIFIARGIRAADAKRRAALDEALQELARDGETVLVQPTVIGLRSGHVSGRATVCLTDRRLLVFGAGNKRRDIPRAAIGQVDVARAFHGKITGGRSFVIVRRRDGEPDLGLHVPVASAEHWRAQLAPV